MNAQSIKLDGNDILHGGDLGIYYIEKSWRNNISVSDNMAERVGAHGRDVTATFARIRTVTLAGYIDRMAGSDGREAVEWLENLFAYQDNPSILIPRSLEVTDIYGRVFTLDVKVKDALTIEEGSSEFIGSHWAWRVSLESIGDPTFRVGPESSVNTVEGAYGGFSIPNIIPFSMDDMLYLTTITPAGNMASFPVFTFTATADVNAPVTIRNITDGTHFSLNVNASSGDIIVVDSDKKTCTKNGSNISALRLPGSTWQKIKGETSFLFTDNDGGQMLSDFGVKISYISRYL